MRTKNIDWEGNGIRWIGLTPYRLHVPVASRFGSFRLLEASGAVICLCRDSVAFVRVLIIAHVVYFDFMNIIQVTK